ncbi:hypothetical protein AVV44_gp173 [Cronobacter phage S13]|uniref:Uncharacterized protein n=1 Tax=Cronobacter phage LPCS28 TaxID=2924885 RepID=A0AAE9G5C9_9CAUD|nr:hypothetical protein AVV44_gp173 [Cronobacter phage S13]YP_010665848.1 hypothetical protein PQB73_gp176 [Cronobacter phage LPCS28]AIA65065.1 hypothetical protein S13_268 [Cronobacter phage S13]UNY47037.1 hypothetical protein EHEKIMEA_00155 [Cronobacter phage LPCS28]
MKVKLKYPLYIVRNTLLPNGFADTTTDPTNWRLHSDGKYVFNVYEFLDKIGRLDVLARHFDHMHPNDVITDRQFWYINGKPSTGTVWRYGSRNKPTVLDEEMELLVKAHPNEWQEVMNRKINWQKQRIFVFDKVEELEY